MRVYFCKECFPVLLIKIVVLSFTLFTSFFAKFDDVALCCEKYLGNERVRVKSESLFLQGTFPCTSD